MRDTKPKAAKFKISETVCLTSRMPEITLYNLGSRNKRRLDGKLCRICYIPIHECVLYVGKKAGHSHGTYVAYYCSTCARQKNIVE